MKLLHSSLSIFSGKISLVVLLTVALLLTACQPEQGDLPPASQSLPIIQGSAVALPPTPTPTPIPRSTSLSTPLGQKGRWNLIFHDEFDGNTLDTSKWSTCYFNFIVGDGCDHDQSELELYLPNNVSVSHGMLNLQANRRTITAVNGRTYNYTSGMISTGPAPYSSYPKFAFTYGYVEMRAKIPAGTGFWPAFWMLPASLGWPPEIDIFEMLGRDPSTYYMHYHYSTAARADNQVRAVWAGPNFSANMHTFGLDWEPGSLTWYVDGVERYRYTDAATVPTQPMYLIANLAIGGNWAKTPTASTPFPSAFQIDYVRIWQK